MTTKPYLMPPQLQADLHRDGLLDDPDYQYNKQGQVQLNIDKFKRYIRENGGPWH